MCVSSLSSKRERVQNSTSWGGASIYLFVCFCREVSGARKWRGIKTSWNTHTHIHTQVPAHHTHTHTPHRHPYTHSHIYTHAHTYSHVHTPTQACARIHMHTYGCNKKHQGIYEPILALYNHTRGCVHKERRKHSTGGWLWLTAIYHVFYNEPEALPTHRNEKCLREWKWGLLLRSFHTICTYKLLKQACRSCLC